MTWLSVVRPVSVAIVVGLLAAALIAGSAAGTPVASCHGPTSQPKNVGSVLAGVAATSACKAWAVGTSASEGQTLVEHWNGKAWKVQPSPNPSSQYNGLSAVAATSATNAWAVGSVVYPCCLSDLQGLIEHWNGKAWRVQPSPKPAGPYNQLLGVAAISAKDAWAVGYYSKSLASPMHALVEHWNGKAWKIQPSPKGYKKLSAVTATSATNVWAVGSVGSGDGDTLVEHWNGKAWKIQPSPDPRASFEPELDGVAATSANNAWAVGAYFIVPDEDATRAFVEHWNGKAWTVQRSPNRGQDDGWLYGVAATSAKNAWTVGSNNNDTLVEHWNGKAWKVQPSPSPGSSSEYPNQLYGVAATSAKNAWAVGRYPTGTGPYGTGDAALILHWNGTAWTR